MERKRDRYSKWWQKLGKITRNHDLPTRICDSKTEWYINDKHIRHNLPAVVHYYGTKTFVTYIKLRQYKHTLNYNGYVNDGD
jgi:hypothetical protein